MGSLGAERASQSVSLVRWHSSGHQPEDGGDALWGNLFRYCSPLAGHASAWNDSFSEPPLAISISVSIFTYFASFPARVIADERCIDRH